MFIRANYAADGKQDVYYVRIHPNREVHRNEHEKNVMPIRMVFFLPIRCNEPRGMEKMTSIAENTDSMNELALSTEHLRRMSKRSLTAL